MIFLLAENPIIFGTQFIFCIFKDDVCIEKIDDNFLLQVKKSITGWKGL